MLEWNISEDNHKSLKSARWQHHQDWKQVVDGWPYENNKQGIRTKRNHIDFIWTSPATEENESFIKYKALIL